MSVPTQNSEYQSETFAIEREEDETDEEEDDDDDDNEDEDDEEEDLKSYFIFTKNIIEKDNMHLHVYLHIYKSFLFSQIKHSQHVNTKVTKPISLE